MRKIVFLIPALLLLAACSQNYRPLSELQSQDPYERWAADSLNIYSSYRTYPVPQVKQTPAPKGFEPVYVSMYARHGSRKLHREDYCSIPLSVLSEADSKGQLTPLGRTVLGKVKKVYDDLGTSLGDLTRVGEAQHRGIAQRMYLSYKGVFTAPGAVVRCYSTVVQRTMMSMFAENSALLSLNPGLEIERSASKSLTCLNNQYSDPCSDDPHRPCDEYLEGHLDFEPILDRLFSGGRPQIEDKADLVRCLYLTGAIAPCLDIEGCYYLRELFTPGELYVLQRGMNYMMYLRCGNSELNGDNTLPSQIPLLQDIVDKADAALATDAPGADLRFGHDSYVMPLAALINLNGYGTRVSDRAQIEAVFPTYELIPMAANLQFVFYRNKKGIILVKLLHNEVESAIPVQTECFPYYRWEDVKAYFAERISIYNDRI